MSKAPVISIKRKQTKSGETKWLVIIRAEIYEPVRLTTTTQTLGQAVTVGEAHLKFWGYNEIETTKAIANMYRNLRRRYGAEVMLEAVSPTQKEAMDQLEPYPD